MLPASTRNHTLRIDWKRSVDAFMASAALYVSSPDHASPTNTGIWLAKPRRWVHSQVRYLGIAPSIAAAVGAQPGTLPSHRPY